MDLVCQACGAALVVDDHVRTARCPYCASPSIVTRPPTPDRPRPAFTLPFALAEGPARELVAGWLGSRGFFREPALKTAQITDMRGVYVPVYLYAAVAHTDYGAEIGEDYQETETYTDRDANGNSVTRTRTVTKTEWRAFDGRHAAYVSDVLVTASRGLANHELERVEPFDLRQLRRFAEALLSGWIVEEPTLPVAHCAGLARGEALASVGPRLAAFMPGDRHRGLRHATRLEHESAELVHVPVWILAARHAPNAPPVRLVVNGQTGRVWGEAPLSALRVVAAIAVVVAVLVGLVFALSAWGGR